MTKNNQAKDESGERQSAERRAAPSLSRKLSKLADSDAVEQLRVNLRRANALATMIDGRLTEAATIAQRAAEVEHELLRLKQDSDELATRLVGAEEQAERLMNLYVATYQLHGTLDPSEVQATIAEITINLLGSERFALLLRNAAEATCEVAVSEGLDEDDSNLFSDGCYVGGAQIVDDALAKGEIQIAQPGAAGPVAAVPLTVQGVVVGVLVILKLLDHRAWLGANDREFLDLLSAHAASALLAARAFEESERKLRTLKGLVELARGR